MRSEKLLWLVIFGLGIAVIVLISRHDEGAVGPLDTNSFASLVYFSALLLLIGGGVYAMFYGRLQEALKSVAIWLGIAAVLALIYTYRGDIGRVMDRVFTAVTPTDALVTGSITPAASVTRAPAGEFNLLARVNNAELVMLVDTGASSVVLTVEDARAAGLPVDLLKYDVTIQTAKGRGHAASVVIDKITVGGITERRVPALVAQPGQLQSSLLGMSFLSRLESFEVRGERLVLRGRY